MIENHHEQKQPKNSFTTLLFLPHILGLPLRLSIKHSALEQQIHSQRLPRMSDSVQLFFQVLVDVSLGDLKSTLTRVATLKAL